MCEIVNFSSLKLTKKFLEIQKKMPQHFHKTFIFFPVVDSNMIFLLFYFNV